MINKESYNKYEEYENKMRVIKLKMDIIKLKELYDEPCFAKECADRIRKEKGLSPNAPVILHLVCPCRRCSIWC